MAQSWGNPGGQSFFKAKVGPSTWTSGIGYGGKGLRLDSTFNSPTSYTSRAMGGRVGDDTYSFVPGNNLQGGNYQHTGTSQQFDKHPGFAPRHPQTQTPITGNLEGGAGQAQGGDLQGQPNISTGINPSGIYDRTQTTEAANLAHAQAETPLPWLLNKLARPGAGTNDPNTMALAMGPLAQQRAQQGAVMQQIPFGDAGANAAQLLQGQVGRENASQGWAGQLNNLYGMNNQYANSTQANQIAGMGQQINQQGNLLSAFSQFI